MAPNVVVRDHSSSIETFFLTYWHATGEDLFVLGVCVDTHTSYTSYTYTHTHTETGGWGETHALFGVTTFFWIII